MDLNPQQRAAVNHAAGHLLVLAGAGTGKTSTIIARVANLISLGVDASRILLLTFTRRAAKEMLNRLEFQVGQVAKRVQAGTFHHFGLLTMRRMPQYFGIQGATILDRDDQLQIMKLARAGHLKKGERLPQAQELVDTLSYARNTNQPVRNYLEMYSDYDEPTTDRLIQIFQTYQKRKATNTYLDFDDILLLLARGLHTHEACHARISGMYDHVLVDEMQDTNPLQWLILDGMRDPAQLYCVGDDAQSIYAFRGADFRNVHSFQDRIPEAVVLKLDQNYRSTQEILDVSNWVLAESPIGYDKRLVAIRGKGVRPRLLEFEFETDEALWIADDIAERREGGAALADHMIIARTAWRTKTLQMALVEKRIPYVFIGGVSLLQSAHVKDLLSLVRAAMNPKDELAWIRYLTLWPRVGDRTAGQVISDIQNLKAMEQVRETLARRFGHDAALIAPLDAVAGGRTASEAIAAGANALEPTLAGKYDRWPSRKKDFELLSRLATKYRSLLDFVETYTLDPISEASAIRLHEHDVVTLITAHSAKGTEAPVCYAVGVEPGQYPHTRSLGSLEQEEEDRRVLYVALTRARDELIITRVNCVHGAFVPSGSYAGDHSEHGQGYFLEQLPSELVNIETYRFEQGAVRSSGEPYADPLDAVRSRRR